ncbi:MAG: TonB-dependent receptor [Tannerella sp.]|nr:TonB-dependent receptor [Tannerella sp.]
MKVFVLMLFVGICAAHADNAHSQDTKLSLRLTDISIKEAINEIEKKSDYVFVFADDTGMETDKKVNIKAEESNVAQILDNMFAGTLLAYRIIDRQVVVFRNMTPKALDIATTVMSIQPSQPAKEKITGTVVDVNGEPIIGANVVEKGTTNGNITDVDGKFSLSVSDNAVLQISFIGYITQEISAVSGGGGGKPLIIKLIEDNQALEEVVVVGYGTQKKVTLTGAVANIKSEKIVTTKATNIQNALSGKIAGVQNISVEGEPGQFTNIFQIRGMGTPLYVIDGVPRDNFVKLDPNEVESISVLKDAAAAIYGVRAANGVVLVTTKKGQTDGKFQMEYTGYYGQVHIVNPGEAMTASEHMRIVNEDAFNAGNPAVFSEETIQSYLNGTKKETDWMQVMRASPQTYHNINASGGTEKLNYYTSFGFNKEYGAWKSGDLNYQRFNLRSNVTAQLAKGLKAEVLLNLMSDAKNRPSGLDTYRVFQSMWVNDPAGEYYANGNPDYPTVAGGRHPEIITDADKSGYLNIAQRVVNTNMALEWDIPGVKGLKARGMYGYDYNVYNNKQFQKKYYGYTYDSGTDAYLSTTLSAPSFVKRSYVEYINTLLQLSLSYTGTFNKVHNVSGNVIYEEGEREADNFSAQRNLTMDVLDQLFTGDASTQQAGMNTAGINDLTVHNGTVYHNSSKSFIGRFTYDYNSKYLAEFGFRFDGSSKFASGRQWGFFPSASAGWRIAEEAFIKDNDALKFINNLKIRGSYGIMGDDADASNYQFLTGYTYPSGGYVVNGTYENASVTTGLPNKLLTWYESKFKNIGLDADLWGGLLGVVFDIYRRDRSGLMARRNASIPGIVGITLPQENLNSDMTQGIELTLSHLNRIGDFSYNISGNAALSRTTNKYVEQGEFGNSYLNWRGNSNDRYSNVSWGMNYIGQFQSFDDIWNSGAIYNYGSTRQNAIMLPGDLMYEDYNGDGLVDDGDFIPFSTENFEKPILTYGFTIGAEYKGFDLNMVFQGVGMRWSIFGGLYGVPGTGGSSNGIDIFVDRWHRADESNPSVDQEWVPGHFPSMWSARGGQTIIRGAYSSFWMVNSSYLRMKSLEVGYTIPVQWSKIVGLERARIFANAYNLFTLSPMNYFADPEYKPANYVGSSPSDFAASNGTSYPATKTFNIGVTLTF